MFTANLNSFLNMVCLIETENQNLYFSIDHTILARLRSKALYLCGVLLNSFKPPKGTPLMLNLATYQFSAFLQLV